MNESSAYGLWSVVILNSMVMLLFVFGFFRPKTRRDWRSFGAFSAFIVALFTEMYGFPLTVYLFSGWLGSRYPEIDWLSHDAGHTLQTFLGWKGDPHAGPLHLVSDILMIAGFALIALAWKKLHRAQRNDEPAVTGPYAVIRHPQYTGFVLIMLGFLVQWPTLPTLAMFPVLVWMYFRLAMKEEKEALAQFGERYLAYMDRTPRFLPRIGGSWRAAGGSFPHSASGKELT